MRAALVSNRHSCKGYDDAMGARTLVSRADFECLPEEDRYEMDCGELVPMTAPKRRHSQIQIRIHQILTRAAAASRYSSVEP